MSVFYLSTSARTESSFLVAHPSPPVGKRSRHLLLVQRFVRPLAAKSYPLNKTFIYSGKD